MNRAIRDVVRRKSSVAHLQSSSKTIPASQIRKTFLDYFCVEKDHMFVKSSPVFSLKDPTLAFTNAGMNQFKEVFLGLVEPPSKRVANSQKCIRIGGKHNDLLEVGNNGRHHTFFEMLGNWSFEDYFKEEACSMSWELLTKVFCIPPERLYVTYFKGDQNLGLKPDFEVKEIWRKIGVEDSHILAFGAKENFWSGSVTGPCGPCTEIHYNHSADSTDAPSLVNFGSDAVTELWNLVFIQYNKESDGTLKQLKTHFIDTGMGFERLVAVLQGKMSNYETDLFLPLFDVIQKHTGHSGYTGEYGDNVIDNSYRILADHSRMIAVCLSDGMLPNHQNQVRRLLRKTFRIIEDQFKADFNLLKKLTTYVAESLSDTYPEIEKNLSKIHYFIEEEVALQKIQEKEALARWNQIKNSYPAFQNVLPADIPQITRGLNYVNKNILQQGKKELSSKDIFELYETYGVFTNNIILIAEKLGLKYNLAEYEKYSEMKKEIIKTATHKKFIKSFTEYNYTEVINKLKEKNVKPTDDSLKYNYKVDSNGVYVFEDQPTTISAILLDKNLVDEITPEDDLEGKKLGIILDKTHLFSRDGGQVSDLGTLKIRSDFIFNIVNVVKIKNFVIHFGEVVHFSGHSKVAVEDAGILKLNENRRLSIMRNHTGLHVLKAALRHKFITTGEKYSEVTPDKLMLKIMVYQPNDIVGTNDITKLVENFITNKVNVERKLYPREIFHSLNDVVYIPGENILSNEVPVIEINDGCIQSREYCTGTHVLNTSHLEDFIIINYIKSYKVHKIEAVTGDRCFLIKMAEAELQEKWSCLQNKIDGEPSEELLQELKEFYECVSKSEEISYSFRRQLEIETLKEIKYLNDLLKSIKREFLQNEIKNLLSPSTKDFIVHSLDYNWTFNPEDLQELKNEIPIMIFFRRGMTVFIQCIVPEEFVSKEFSAREWLLQSVLTLTGTAYCKKNQNSNLIFYTSEVKCSETKLRHAMEKAIYFAKENMKTKKECAEETKETLKNDENSTVCYKS